MSLIQKDTKRKIKNPQYIRLSNRAEIIRNLSIYHEATRLKLASHLGLSKMAISNIINEMLAEGLVIECATLENLKNHSLSGRKSTLVKLNTNKFKAIGIYISRDELQGIVADISGQILQTWRKPLNMSDEKNSSKNREKFISELFSLIDKIIEETTVQQQVQGFLGIGICSIGPLDLKNGILLAPPNFHGIEHIDLLSLIKDRYQLPILLDNDMNASAWGEHLYGAGQNSQHVVYLGITNGIGAGIITYGRIFQGSEGYGGELGHMSIQMDGPFCSCGQQGCLELYTSVPVLLKKTKMPNIEALICHSQVDENFRESWLPEFEHALLAGLVNVANIFDPDVILIGHEGAALVELDIEELEKKTNLLAFQHRSKNIPIKLARFGEKAPLIGAASLVFQAVFRGDLGVGASNTLSDSDN